MTSRIAQRFFYYQAHPALGAATEEYAQLTGRRYDLVRRYRMEDAEC